MLVLGPLLLSCRGTLRLSNDCIFLKLLDIFLTLALSGLCTLALPPPASTSTAGPTVTGDEFVCILKYPLCFIEASRSSIVCFALSLKAAAMDLIRANRCSLNAAPDAV